MQEIYHTPKPVNDGGAAFPLAPAGTGDPRDGMAGGSVGMSLRAYAATEAMNGLLSNTAIIDVIDGHGAKWIAERAVLAADALIAALEARP